VYLISLYFDENTTKNMQKLIDEVAKVTGNTFMIDGKIPPHITLLEFDTKDEEAALDIFNENVSRFVQGNVLFAAIGTLKKQVIYVEPVLNEFLHNMSLEVYGMFKALPDLKLSPYYQPFGWIPHMSLGKHLDSVQITKAFETVVNKFDSFEGMVTRIGIAKTNPHRDLINVEISRN
jgi:hypothetical protein